jgi:Zn-dependent protease with chaperone function
MANKTLAYYLGSFGAGTLASMIPGAGEVAGAALSLPLLHWSRMAELSCDRAALLVVQDPAIVARALSKLAGWSIPGLGAIDLDEVMRQINEEEAADPEMFDSLARIKHSMDTLAQTHPLPLLRMTRILQWGQSDQFREILNGRYPRV